MKNVVLLAFASLMATVAFAFEDSYPYPDLAGRGAMKLFYQMEITENTGNTNYQQLLRFAESSKDKPHKFDSHGVFEQEYGSSLAEGFFHSCRRVNSIVVGNSEASLQLVRKHQLEEGFYLELVGEVTSRGRWASVKSSYFCQIH